MRVLCVILILACGISAYSQNGVVSGNLVDTVLQKAVGSATITLLKQQDSSLVSFTMADNKGRFEINNIPTGMYRLLITHTNYHNKNLQFSINADNPLVNYNNLVMKDRLVTLDEVIVSSEAPPVVLLGDTIEYNAPSFKTIPNASVEDLLKKLPGVKVEKDGTVKAQGEKVQRVLVDGKEFFGNDPKMATKNLPADAIDKVQVYDRMSDQAQLTGFDDGNSEKTINLKLKKDRKKGGFGRATVGYGTDEKYDGKFNLNSFKGARQMSMLSTANNINGEGFSVMDMLSFTGALNQMKNSGSMTVSIGSDDPLAGMLGGNNNGINTTRAGGLNYNNIIGKKTDWQSNYFFSHYNPLRLTDSRRQFFTPELVTSQKTVSDNIANSHRLNFSADQQLDSFHSIKLTGNFGLQATNNSSIFDYSTFSDKGKISDGNNNSTSEKSGSTLTSTLLFRKKFHRRARTFSFNLTGTYSSSEGSGFLHSVSKFFDPVGSLAASNTIRQQNLSNAKNTGSSVRGVYTEPLSKRSLLEFSLGQNTSRSSSDKSTFDYNPIMEKYDLINNALTNEFASTYTYSVGGLRIRTKNKKLTYAVGANWQEAKLSGTTAALKDSSISRTFSDILPTARFQYTISRSKNITLNYNAYTTQPTISQLQPVPDNSNPLYIPVGNPNLQQEYSHGLRLNTSTVNPFKNRNMFVQLAFVATQNKIENSHRINALGVDSVMPVNVNGVYNLTGNISYSFPVNVLKSSFEISTNISHARSKQFLNGNDNVLKSINLGPQLTWYINPTANLDFTVGLEYTYSNTNYSLARSADAVFLQQEYSLGVNWTLPKKWQFGSDFSYRITDNDAADFHTTVPLWNFSVGKQFLAVNRGQLKLSVNDLLNKNLLISRTANSGYIEDRSILGLRRYAMLSFTYNLKKTGLMNANGGGVRVMR